jgi:ADP-ribose pyrophosphatase
MNPTPWKRLKRTTVIDTQFIKVHFDKLELADGSVIDDYSVASLPSGVIIVATDMEGKLLTQHEYKYAIDKVILNLPSGSVENGMSPLETAAQELKEETGYVSDDLELVDILYEYPSKLDHVIYIVRAKNAHKEYEVKHEVTEAIGPVRLLTPDMEDFGGVFDTTYTVSALALTLPEYLKK